MKSYTFTIEGKSYTVTRNKVLKAMREFDMRCRARERDSGTVYAILHAGKRYPPKRILAMAIGRDKTEKLGGGEKRTNKILRDVLDFTIVKVASGKTEAAKQHTRTGKLLRAACPPMKTLIRRLFSGQWENLHENYSQLPLVQYPGVYLLAYSRHNLQRKKPRVQDVFYVGMSNSSVSSRLESFLAALEKGRGHSGGNRFFEEYARQVPYSQLRPKKKFFVTSTSIPCTYKKSHRTPSDLRKMGQVAALEYHALAYIKERTGNEPDLNKK